MRWRVDLLRPAKTVSSSVPGTSGSESRWRDGWISGIGRNPAARSAGPYPVAAGISASLETTSTPWSPSQRAIATRRAAAGSPSSPSSPEVTGPRGM